MRMARSRRPAAEPAAARRRGSGLFVVVVALAIVVISVMLVRSKMAAAPSTSAARTAAVGALTVRTLEPLLPEARLGTPVRVAILRDPASVAYYDDRAVIDSILGWWRTTLTDLGATAGVVAPDDRAALRAASVLLVPSQPCLGTAARRAIDDALLRGGGVIVTWLTGTRDGGCAPVGWSLPARLSGAMRLDTLETRNATYVAVAGNAPLGADIPPGSRLELLVANHVAARVPGRHVLYTDRAMNPAPAGDQPLLDAAIAHVILGRGRAVLLGFEPMRAAPSPWNRAVAALLTRNVVAWAAGLPTASVEPWPAGKKAAAMIAQDVEDGFGNASHAVDSLDAAGVRGTWYLVSDLARSNRALVRRLARNGEIGTHTENHLVLAGGSEGEQARRLANTQHQLADLLGRTVAGLRPPEEQFDIATLRAWADAGGTYVFGANDARTASPELLAVGGDTLVLLARVTNDDVISVHRAGKIGVPGLVAEYESALGKVEALGGLYILSYHSQFMSRPELVPVVAALARRMRGDSTLWRTTGHDVARWWLARHRLRTSTALATDGALKVDVDNAGHEAADSVVVRVVVPGAARVSSMTGATSLPAVAGEARLLFPRIPARGRVSALLVMEAMP